MKDKDPAAEDGEAPIDVEAVEADPGARNAEFGDAEFVDAETVDAEPVETETLAGDPDAAGTPPPGQSSRFGGPVPWLAAALIAGLIIGPFLHAALSPVLPDWLRPAARTSAPEQTLTAALAERLGVLEKAARERVRQIAGLEQQVRELQLVERSRQTNGEEGGEEGSKDGGDLAALEKRIGLELAQLAGDLAQLSATVKQQLKSTAETARPTLDLGAIERRLGDLETTMVRLSGGLDRAAKQAQGLVEKAMAPLGSQVGDLARKLETLRARSARQLDAAKREAFAIALLQLRIAVQRGDAFQNALAAVTARFADDAAVAGSLAALEQHAAAGVADLDDLRQGFAAMVRAVLSDGKPGGGGIWQSIKGRLSGLISVRRTGPVPGKDAKAVLARAEVKLATGDLKAAVAELAALDAPAQARAKSWLDAARARLRVEQAITDLAERAATATGGQP